MIALESEKEEFHNLVVFYNSHDPMTYDEGVKHKTWRKEMDQDI